MNAGKPFASLSLDLDNQWSYLKTHGDPGWAAFPSYLDALVPRILRFLETRGLTATFFVVGQDAALEKNRAAFGAIAAAGHEIGNHSFHHEAWRLPLQPESQVESELARAEEAIEHATGQRPVGFRGPGLMCSQAILQVLARRGYLYDSSTLPSFLGPLGWIYYAKSAKFSPEERRQRSMIYGSFWDGFRPLRPYRWRPANHCIGAGFPARLTPEVIEIPVTTLPGLKIPFHLSYIMHISAFSPRLALAYFKTALWLCRLTRTQPSILLHPTDFLGCDDASGLSFFPGMGLSREKKIEVLDQALRLLSEGFTVLTLRQHAYELMRSDHLPLVAPNFGPARRVSVRMLGTQT